MATNHKGPTNAALIYNPNAGKKRKLFSLFRGKLTALEDIKDLLTQYQIPVDYFPTKHPGHATDLAKECIKKGYKTILAAGGDGTVGEVANGLVGTESTLGILPLGSFMNIAKMLSLPQDLEKAIMIIKMAKIRKIDVGVVKSLNGQKLDKPYFFIEGASVGLEAELHKHVLEFEQGNFDTILKAFKTIIDYYSYKATIRIDEQEIQTRATLVTISNGPLQGASIPLAEDAKLNDHRLTVKIFRLTKWELLYFLVKLLYTGQVKRHKIQTIQGKSISIVTHHPRSVHADARLYGTTPFELEIYPNALNVFAGFPKKGERVGLLKKTYLGY